MLLLAAAGCAAQTPDVERTNGRLNGRFWEELRAENKIIFIVGITEGLRAGELPSLGLLYPPGATVGDVIKALDGIYAAPENLRVSVNDALRVVSMTFRGDKPEDIEAALRWLRIAASTEQSDRPAG